jgi:hypothetical protein
MMRKISPDGRQQQFIVTLSPSQKDQFENAAHQLGTTRTALARIVLSRWLDTLHLKEAA